MIYQRLRIWRNSTAWAILLGSVGCLADVAAEDLSWTYDFSTGSAADWNHNTNNPAATFSAFLPGTASLGYTGKSTFQSTAIHKDSFALGVGDSLSFRMAWSPFNTVASANGNNEVFQLGAINLDGQSWATTDDRFGNSDSFWLSGREIESTAATKLDEWGTQKLNLWMNTDELKGSILDVDVAKGLGTTASVLGYGLGLGTLDIETFKQGSDGSISATFLDIDLALTLVGDGSFDYEVEIFSYEWTQLGGVTSWFNEGLLFSTSGNRQHQMASTDALNPAIGFLVSDSSQLGVSSSAFGQAPLLVPEPGGALLVFCGLASLGMRRRRH